MSARDIFHQAVCSALMKEGWSITDDPLTLEFEEVTLYVDLGAERLIAAQKGIEKIAVEIKTFLRDSLVTELHLTVGQLLNYRLALLESEPERILYLAVPKDPYFSFFTSRYAQRIIQAHQIKLIIYDPEIEEIIQWL